MKSRSFASFSKVDFFYMEPDLSCVECGCGGVDWWGSGWGYWGKGGERKHEL